MSLSEQFTQHGIPKVENPIVAGPLWKGPEEDGITFSLLSRFLVCRERFRVHAIMGLRPVDSFNHRIEYGNLWHAGEEAFASTGKVDGEPSALSKITEYAAKLMRKYPTDREAINHWWSVCKVQFPLYVEHWRRHPDVLHGKVVSQEEVFDIDYSLPSGRIVRLRGKMDKLFSIGHNKGLLLYLQENKVKGDINEQQIRRQLTFDLQTMMYLTALKRSGYIHNQKYKDIGGVIYNVVRRPLSGGKGTIRQHQPTKSNPAGESKAQFYSRVGKCITEDPGHYFMRWKSEVSSADITAFAKKSLEPILEQLCDWWQVQNGGKVDPNSADYQHYRMPYGVYNVLLEGGASEVDEYLNTGSTVGLTRASTLYPELES